MEMMCVNSLLGHSVPGSHGKHTSERFHRGIGPDQQAADKSANWISPQSHLGRESPIVTSQRVTVCALSDHLKCGSLETD